jgi:hypothetical protein
MAQKQHTTELLMEHLKESTEVHSTKRYNTPATILAGESRKRFNTTASIRETFEDENLIGKTPT